MSTLLYDNSYHVLGLTTQVSQREILKRAKVITNRLKIDDIPTYPTDLSDATSFRTLPSLKKAVNELSSPKNRVKHYFFCFHNLDEEDSKAISLIRGKQYSEARTMWDKKVTGTADSAIIYRKNIVMLLCLSLYQTNNSSVLIESMNLWRDLIKSKQFWKYFFKDYADHDEFNTKDEVLNAFSETLAVYMSDIYTDLSEMHQDPSILARYSGLFGNVGSGLERQILEPIFSRMNDFVEKLEALAISEDGVFDQEEAKTIKYELKQIQDSVNTLIDYGQYEDGRSVAMRDRAVKAIRAVVLDLHNNLQETGKAIPLMKIALQLCGTQSLRHKIRQDIETIEGVKHDQDIVKPIQDLIDAMLYSKALSLIERERIKSSDNSNLQDYFDVKKKECVTGLAMLLHTLGQSRWEAEDWDASSEAYRKAGKTIYENLGLYDVNKDGVDKTMNKIKATMREVNADTISELDDFRNSMIESVNEKLEGAHERAIMVILMDAYIFGPVCQIIKRAREKAKVVNILSILGWLTIWIYGLGLIFFIAIWVYKSGDNNYQEE